MFFKKKIFLCYSSKQSTTAEEIALLLGKTYIVFHDRTDLKPSVEYKSVIHEAILKCDLFIFLISPDSVKLGSFPLGELEVFKNRFQNHSGNLLPVTVLWTDLDQIPTYIRQVTILNPKGNISLAVLDEVNRKFARRLVRPLLGFFALTVLLLIGLYLYNPIFKSQDCYEMTSSEMGVLITRFGEEEGGFSNKLFNELSNNLRDSDSIRAKLVDRYLQPKNTMGIVDSLKAFLANNCINSGLLVYGNKNTQSDLFDCYVYINNPILSGTDLIYIKNPDTISFSIENQAKAVSKFILGMLYGLDTTKTQLAIASLQEARRLNNNQDNNRFLTYCNLFLGNNYFRQGSTALAIKEFQEGIVRDSTKALLYYNLGIAYLESGETTLSIEAFLKATKLDTSLVSPVQTFKQTVVVSNQAVWTSGGHVFGIDGNDTVTYAKLNNVLELGVADTVDYYIGLNKNRVYQTVFICPSRVFVLTTFPNTSKRTQEMTKYYLRNFDKLHRYSEAK